MSDTQVFDIAIIGAGIAGVAFAIACENSGVRYTLYESGPEIWQHGLGIGVAPNAIRALEAIDTRMPVKLKEIGSQRDGISADFNYKHGQRGDGCNPFDPIITVPTGEAQTVARSDLMNVMVPMVPKAKIKFGKHLASIIKKQRVQLNFRDGATAEHDIVVGSDSIHSKTRHWILGNDPDAIPRFTGKIMHRGVVPATVVQKAFPGGHCEGVTVFLGHHGHIVMMPIHDGRDYSITAVASRKTWKNEKWVVSSTAGELRDDYGGWADCIVQVLEGAGNTDIWALFDLPFCCKFTKGPVTILGDAAHSSTPFQGSGTSMALEDAHLLAKLLARSSSVSQARAALEAYDAVRRPRTQKQVQTALETGWIMDFEHPMIGDDVEAYKRVMSTRTRWLWDFDLEAEMDLATAEMNSRA